MSMGLGGLRPFTIDDEDTHSLHRLNNRRHSLPKGEVDEPGFTTSPFWEDRLSLTFDGSRHLGYNRQNQGSW